MTGLRGNLALCLLAVILSSMACSADPPDTSKTPLLAGSQPVAKVGFPAVLNLRLERAQLNPQAQLELTVSPTVVHPHDSYIIKVSESRLGKPVGTELGSFSFFPPATKDQPRTFLVDVPKASAVDKEGKTQLTVELVPTTSSKAAAMEIRVLSARLVQPQIAATR
jgi:hypothetical protein